MSDRSGLGHSIHNTETQSITTVEEKLAKTLEKRSSHVELVAEVHTNKSTSLIQDHVARNLVESVNQAAEEYRQSQEFWDSQSEGADSNEVPVEKLNQIYDELTSRNKRRVYGRSKDHRTATSRFSKEIDLQILLEEMTARMTELEEEILLVKATNKKEMDDFKQEMTTQMETMMTTMRTEFSRHNTIP